MKKNLMKALLAIPVTLVHHIMELHNYQATHAPVAELFMEHLFSGSPSRTTDDIVMNVIGLFEILIFNLIFGTFLYHDLNTNGIYAIARQKGRHTWYFRKVAELFLYTVIWVSGYLTSVLLLSSYTTSLSIDSVAVTMFVTTLIILTFFAFVITLLINLCAIRFGSNFGFVIVYLALILLTGLAIINEKIPFLKNLPLLLKLNPMANAVVNWDLSGSKTLFACIYFFAFSLLAVLIGLRYIAKMDIGIQDRENSQ
ncbi:hypothetical protein FACS1894111_09050 [Clostridia bacterium]|nr:hypothetical protein FACS1894111_09050 [Clostridia bacterium]